MQTLIGATAVDALVEVLTIASRPIRLVEVATIPEAPLVQHRGVLDSTASEIVDRALTLRSDTSLPFWDAAMVNCFGSHGRVLPLFEAALYHNSLTSRHALRVEGNQVADQIQKLFPTIEDSNVLALLSSVRTVSGEVAHLPLLDFHLPATPFNEKVALEALQALGIGPGYLLASGKSYHFIGSRLIEFSAFPRFLARALLLSPVIDRSWIAHQIIEGRSAVRISPKPGRHDAPRVVATYEPALSPSNQRD